MPITRIQSSSGITSRGPTADDAGFTVSLQVRDTIVTPGSTVTSTVDDRSITTQTGATVDRAGDIDAVETVQGTFTPYLRFESLNEAIATVDSVGNVTRVSDGTVRILCKTKLRTEPLEVTVSRTTDTTVVFDGYVAGSLAKDWSDAVDTRLSGETPATSKPVFSSTNVRNTACWAYDTDLTCVSSSNTFGVTAISANHGLISRHVESYFPVGTSLTFVASDGTALTGTVANKVSIAGSGLTYDLTVLYWSEALPSTITPAKVLPSNVLDYLPSLDAVYSIPCCVVDRERKAVITEMRSMDDGNFIYCHVPVDATRLSFYEDFISGDSSAPVLRLKSSGAPTLVTLLTFGGGGAGPRIHALHSQINAAMTSAGGSQQLTVEDLSSFTDYS